MRICRASTINFFLLRTQRNMYFLSEYDITCHRLAEIQFSELMVDVQVRIPDKSQI